MPRKCHLPIAILSALALAAASLVSGAATATAATYALPSTIARDCSAPATARLNQWLAKVPSGTNSNPVVVDFGKGCILLDDIDTPGALDVDGLQVIGKSNWRITGSATIRFDTTVPTRLVGGKQRGINRSALTIRDGNNIHVHGLTLRGKRAKVGYDPNVEYDHNMTILGGKSITINKLSMSEAAGDNIAVKAYGTNVPIGVNILNSTLRNASRHNISVTAGVNVQVSGNQLLDNGYWAIDAEVHAAGWPLRNMSVVNNTASGARYGFMALTSRTDTTVGGVSDISVSGNTMKTLAQTQHEFVAINTPANANAPTRNVRITNNRFTVRQYGVSAKWVDGLLVMGNDASSTGAGTGSDCGGRMALLAVGGGVKYPQVTFNKWSSWSTLRPKTDFCTKAGTTVKPIGVMVGGNQ